MNPVSKDVGYEPRDRFIDGGRVSPILRAAYVPDGPTLESLAIHGSPPRLCDIPYSLYFPSYSSVVMSGTLRVVTEPFLGVDSAGVLIRLREGQMIRQYSSVGNGLVEIEYEGHFLRVFECDLMEKTERDLKIKSWKLSC